MNIPEKYNWQFNQNLLQATGSIDRNMIEKVWIRKKYPNQINNYEVELNIKDNKKELEIFVNDLLFHNIYPNRKVYLGIFPNLAFFKVQFDLLPYDLKRNDESISGFHLIVALEDCPKLLFYELEHKDGYFLNTSILHKNLDQVKDLQEKVNELTENVVSVDNLQNQIGELNTKINQIQTQLQQADYFPNPR